MEQHRSTVAQLAGVTTLDAVVGYRMDGDGSKIGFLSRAVAKSYHARLAVSCVPHV